MILGIGMLTVQIGLSLGMPIAAAPIALVGGVIIDGAGHEPIRDGVVVIDHDVISAVGEKTAVVIPPDAVKMDIAGQTVLPGLIDLDVRLDHLGSADLARFNSRYKGLTERVVVPTAAKALLYGGITSARDFSGQSDVMLRARRLINSWKWPGPRLRVAGPWLVSRHHSEWEVDQKEIGSSAVVDVKSEVDSGVDVLVVAAAHEFRAPVLQQLVAAAAQLGVRIEAVVFTDEDALAAINAGITTLNGYTGSEADEISAKLMAKIGELKTTAHGIHWNLGLSALMISDERLQAGFSLEKSSFIPPLILDDLRFSALNTPNPTGISSQPVIARLNALKAAGVHFGVASQAGRPWQYSGEATVREVESLVFFAGMSPLEAIAVATSENARSMGIDAGVIEVGRVADLLVVDGDASQDIRALAHQTMIFESGIRYR